MARARHSLTSRGAGPMVDLTTECDFGCNGNGICVAGKCQCQSGYGSECHTHSIVLSPDPKFTLYVSSHHHHHPPSSLIVAHILVYSKLTAITSTTTPHVPVLAQEYLSNLILKNI